MVTEAWVLSLLLKLEPQAAHRATYERTAKAIADASNIDPLFSGDKGAEKTATLITSTARYESGFIPNAEGDCTSSDGKLVASKAGVCPIGTKPHSYCLVQVGESNFKFLGVTKDEIQTNIDTCVRSGLRLMHISFKVCHERVLEERLSHYAGGGNGCPTWQDAINKSRHRITLALWLFKQARE